MTRPKDDLSNEEWYQEYRRFSNLAENDQVISAPKDDFFGKIEFDAALDFIQAVISRPAVFHHFYHLFQWNEAFLKRPESKDFLPAELDDFPKRSLQIKSEFCDWFRWKHWSRHKRHCNYFNLSGTLNSLYDDAGLQITTNQIADRLRQLDFIEKR